MSLDPGRRETDRKLRKMEKHLRQVYTEAHRDLTKKTEAFFKEFAEADAKMAAQVEAGEVSQRTYKRWRKNQMTVGKHWQAMKEETATQLHHVNETAAKYVNDQLPELYALNYNASARDIQKGINAVRTGYSLELTDARTVKKLATAGKKNLLPYRKIDPRKDIPWNMRKINNAMLQGIIQGESIPKIAKRFEDVGVANEESAIRAARTMVTSVENSARMESARDAEEMGVVMGKVWMSVSDNRTRPWHAQAAEDYSDPIPLDEPFIVDGEEMDAPGDTSASPHNLYNCRCSLGRKVLGFKSILPEDKRGKIKVTMK